MLIKNQKKARDNAADIIEFSNVDEEQDHEVSPHNNIKLHLDDKMVNNRSVSEFESNKHVNKFHQDKMKDIEFDQNSRPSDLEQHDEFKPTIGSIKNKNQPFNNYDGNEGVDDYDEEYTKHNNHLNSKIQRTSLAEKYEFDGI